MGSVYFQEPSTDGAPGIWGLADAMRYQALGKWPTIPATVPDWIKRGPDGALPVDQADYALGKGWFAGRPYPNLHAYMDAAGVAFSRGSVGTYFDSAGILRTAGPNVLRLDHDPLTGKALGARMEGARTNLYTYSNNFAHASWTKSNVIVAPSADADPSGGPGSTKSISTLGTTDTRQVVQTLTFDLGATYTASVFAKAAEYDFVRLPYPGLSFGATTSVFDIVNGTVSFTRGSPNAQISKLQNGWSRASMSKTAISTASGVSGAGSVLVGDNTSYSGDGVSGGLIFGMQLEAAPFMSSYIPTSGGAAQRLVDDLSIDRTAPQEGTVVIEGRTPRGVSPISQCLWQWGAIAANRHFIVRRTSRVMSYVLAISSVSVVTLDMAAVEDDADFRVAVSWRSGQISASLNGGSAVVSTAFSGEFPAASPILVGRSQDFDQAWFGTVARLGIFDRAYSPAELPEVWA